MVTYSLNKNKKSCENRYKKYKKIFEQFQKSSISVSNCTVEWENTIQISRRNCTQKCFVFLKEVTQREGGEKRVQLFLIRGKTVLFGLYIPTLFLFIFYFLLLLSILNCIN